MEEDDEEISKKSSLPNKLEMEILLSRRIFLSDAVTQESANDIIKKLWYLEAKDPGKEILLIINSPGGAVDAGFAIWDQVKMLKSPVKTLITGLAASMGSILSLVADKGNRLATFHSRIMIHQPSLSGVIRGQATDLEIQAKEIIKTKKLLIKIYEDATGKDYKTIEKALDRDTWMSPEEAIEFGILDKVVSSYDEI